MLFSPHGIHASLLTYKSIDDDNLDILIIHDRECWYKVKSECNQNTKLQPE